MAEIASHKPIDLFNDQKPLEIFTQESWDISSDLKTWHNIYDREIKILKTVPPKNLLEDMASMTDKGLMWHFPIDNEQSLDENEVCVVGVVYCVLYYFKKVGLVDLSTMAGK